MAARISQTVVEAAEQGTPAARASQVVAEVEASGSPQARASQTVAEIEASGTPQARASQLVAEVAASGSPTARVSQLVIEFLIRSIDVAQPPLYPTLPGLTYPIKWSPKHFNQSTQAASGAERDVALASSPIHNFELVYSVLRGQFGVASTEFRQAMGFFLRLGGTAGRFLYVNPHDNKATREPLATTDGSTAVFGPITRTFGLGEDVGVEPVGYIDLAQEVRVYLDGVWQDPSTYQILTVSPVNQQLKFFATPSTGQAITMDFSFLYYCKFSEDLEFDEFMNLLWEVGSVKFKSCRAGT